ncbi:autotransporter outer membrane beta-barrel domain-containing protein [Bartonella sp. B35(2025)]
MLNVFRNHVRSCTFTTAVFYFLQVINSNASGSSCNPDEEFYTCNDGKSHTLQNKTYQLKNPQETSSASVPVAIKVQGQGTVVNAEKIIIEGSEDLRSGYGVDVSDKGKVILTDSMLENVAIGLKVDDGVVQMNGGVIESSGMAVSASGNGTDVALSRTNIKTDNAIASFLSSNNAEIRLAGVSVNFTKSSAFYSKSGGKFRIESINVTGRGEEESDVVNSADNPKAVIHLLQSGYALFRANSVDVTGVHGLLVENSSGTLTSDMKKVKSLFDSSLITKVDIKDSIVTVRGDTSYGLYFRWKEEKQDQKGVTSSLLPSGAAGMGAIHLSNTTFTVPEGTAIYSTRANSYLNLSENTKISGDLLLKAVDGAFVVIFADSSILKGGAHVYNGARADINLHRDSTWFLTKRKHKSRQEEPMNSYVSSISLANSTIHFDDQTPDEYQTLYIGKGGKNVYRAQGNVQIHLSASLNHDDLFDHQKIDRILIHGDVFGKTLVRINNSLGTSKKISDDRTDDRSISVIQVSGKAQEDSFTLIDKYTTLNGSPYQYYLRAYGPDSSLGEADSNERLVSGDGSFWDFRLECSYINPNPDSSEIIPIPDVPSGSSHTDSPSVPSDLIEHSSADLTPISSDTLEPDLADSSSVPSDLIEHSSADLIPISSDTLEPDLADSSSVSSDTLEPCSTDASSISSDTLEISSTDIDSAPTPPDLIEHPSKDSIPTHPIKHTKHNFYPKPRIKAVVPQLPIYLLLPNTLFHTGLMDISNQNKHLEITRSTSNSYFRGDENSAFFMHGYGGNYHYTSDLSAFNYGYGSELDYNALEAGVLLKEIENLYDCAFFGIMGSYGGFSLYPQDVKESRKSTFHKWSVSAYGSIQHDTGLYMDGVVSYGLFKGDVLTLARKKTATLKGKLLNASLTHGIVFIAEHKGLIFNPQVQVVYQYLQFDKERDIDNLNIDMGEFNQWTARFGGHLTKTLDTFEGGRVVSFYGKLNLANNFGGKKFVYFKDAFQLGAFGSSIEAGLGFNAQLSAKLALYGDLIYQHKLTKAGFSGTSFSGGLRYHF